MATAKKSRKAPVKSAAAESAPALAELKLFHDGGGRHENFSFTRAYWPADEEGERESIAGRIDKKRHPVRSDKGELLASAAKTDLVVPLDAPQEYMALDYLVRRYEETLPRHEVNAFAQVTIPFPESRQPDRTIRDGEGLGAAALPPLACPPGAACTAHVGQFESGARPLYCVPPTARAARLGRDGARDCVRRWSA